VLYVQGQKVKKIESESKSKPPTWFFFT